MKTATVKQPTHADSRRNAAQRCMKRVMHLLHWDVLQYTTYKYEEGVRYLHIYLEGDMHDIALIERSPVFWGWWKNQWTIREEEYLNHADSLDKIGVSLRLDSYKGLHNAAMLAAEMNPTSKGLGESYANMMGMLIKEAKKHGSQFGEAHHDSTHHDSAHHDKKPH